MIEQIKYWLFKYPYIWMTKEELQIVAEIVKDGAYTDTLNATSYELIYGDTEGIYWKSTCSTLAPIYLPFRGGLKQILRSVRRDKKALLKYDKMDAKFTKDDSKTKQFIKSLLEKS